MPLPPQHLFGEAKSLKEKGNEQFKAGQFRDSVLTYTQALRLCPLCFESDRAILFHNRAAAKSKMVSAVSSHLRYGKLCILIRHLSTGFVKISYRRLQQSYRT